MEPIYFFVALNGNNSWSGRLAEPNLDNSDGPFATIQQARDEIRKLKQSAKFTKPVIVQLRGGRYHISKPIVFTPDDSGLVTYCSFPGEQAVVDGGQLINNWKTEEINGVRIWSTFISDVAEGNWYFRQLFVNGERRNRARLPKKGFYEIESVPGHTLTNEIFDHKNLFNGSNTFQCKPGDLQNWENLTDIDLVVLHFWTEDRLPITRFDEQTNVVTCARQSIFTLQDDLASRYARYYVENVREALDTPGEWYLDRKSGMLYYLPLADEKPETTPVFAPRCEQLLELRGNPEQQQYVEFLKFEGLSFQHTDWHQPNGRHWLFDQAELPDLPGVEWGAAPQAACNVAGAIVLEGARYCAIENCQIEHLGGYAIELSDGCTSNRIIGNRINDIGAGGIKLIGSDSAGSLLRRTGNNRITDNHIYNGGLIFPSGVGILLTHSFGNRVAYNHIHDLYYSGVSCGWVWTDGESVSKNNVIEYNHIHNLGKGLLNDLGGIYMLGMQPGSVLRGNIIHDIEKHNYNGNGIYLDLGSSYIVIENNICYNLGSIGIQLNTGRENVVRNNIVAFAQDGQINLPWIKAPNASNFEQEVTPSGMVPNFTLERNIIITDNQSAITGSFAGQLKDWNFLSDLNLFWDVGDNPFVCAEGYCDDNAMWIPQRSYNFEEWQSLKRDRYSIVADPLFKNTAAFDFSLEENSPAFALGFRPLHKPEVGPRSIEDWDK